MMRMTFFAGAATAILAATSYMTDASAAPIQDVLGACDRTPGCSYTANGSGDVSGCSPHACFYCPNDGKRECFPVGARQVNRGSLPGLRPGAVKP